MIHERFKTSFAEKVINLDWLGGFFDGEGCIFFKPLRKKKTWKGIEYYYPDLQVIIGQSGELGLQLCKELQVVYGFGKISSTHGSKLTKKTPYMTRLSGKKAFKFLIRLEPYLIIKQQKAKEVISYMADYYDN